MNLIDKLYFLPGALLLAHCFSSDNKHDVYYL